MAKLEQQEGPTRRRWESWYKDTVLILTIGLVFSLDQITKALVRFRLEEYHSFPTEGFFRITRIFNEGSAFGLFPGQTLFLILASFLGIGVLLLVYRHYPVPGLVLRLALGLQLGGASGNLLDRLRTGRVTDFIDVGAWPIFNVADVSIVIGIIIVAFIFLSGRQEVGRLPTGLDGLRASSPSDGDGNVSTMGQMAGVRGSPDGVPEALEDSPCPICDSDMKRVPGGWLCSGCGVKERVENGRTW